jgi:hypothetical protein
MKRDLIYIQTCIWHELNHNASQEPKQNAKHDMHNRVHDKTEVDATGNYLLYMMLVQKEKDNTKEKATHGLDRRSLLNSFKCPFLSSLSHIIGQFMAAALLATVSQTKWFNLG